MAAPVTRNQLYGDLLPAKPADVAALWPHQHP